MKVGTKRKNIFHILISLCIVAGMLLSCCSKSSEESDDKESKKIKNTEVSTVVTDDTTEETPSETETERVTETTTETETTTTETTVPLDPERVRLAGTYNGFALQTKAEAHPENGSVNNFLISQEGRSFRIVLNEDGTALWEDAQDGDREIKEWSASGDSVTIVFADGEKTGTYKDGVLCMDDADKFLFFAADGTDVTGLGVITAAEAKVERGDDYFYGRGGTEYNLTEAVKFYTEAADAGVGKAWFRLGWYYQRKTLAEGHYETALSCYEKATELGSPYGLFGEAGLYEDGLGVQKDPAQALALYQKLADGGNLIGYCGMAHMYRKGTIPGATGSNGAKALEIFGYVFSSTDWFERVYAKNGCGLVCVNGTADMQADYKKARDYFQQAMDEGYPAAFSNMAMMYDHANRLGIDYSKAMELYQTAAAKGDANGYFGVGNLYNNGLGVTADRAEAAKYFKMAADNGSVEGVCRMGYKCCRGDGVPLDYTTGVNYFLIGARENEGYACGWLGNLYCDGNGVPQSDEEAIAWWIKGDALGDATSKANLGWAYHFGHGVTMDYEKALAYYADSYKAAKKAADQETMDYAMKGINLLLDGKHVRQDQVDAALAGA